MYLFLRVISVVFWFWNIFLELFGFIFCIYFCVGLVEFVCWMDVFYSFCIWIVYLLIVFGFMLVSWGDVINLYELWNVFKYLKFFLLKIKEIWFVFCRIMIGRWWEYLERENWFYYYLVWWYCKVYWVYWNEIFEWFGFVCCRYMLYVEF